MGHLLLEVFVSILLLLATSSHAFIAQCGRSPLHAVAFSRSTLTREARERHNALASSVSGGGEGSKQPEKGRNVAVIICDHGSRKATANDMLQEVADRFLAFGQGRSDTSLSFSTVEIAHMELAEPSIDQAFTKCVEQGATHVVLHPFFLSPGRHVTSDIPSLLGEAAVRHPHVTWTLSEPLGLQPLMPELMHEAVQACLGDEQDG